MKLQSDNSSKKYLLVLSLLTALVSIVTFYPTFKFALAGGEDWLTLYRYIKTFSDFASHFDLGNYMGNYDAGNIFMGIIYRYFGFNPLPYYIASLLFRIFAGIGLFLAISRWTGNKLAGTLGTLLFSISYSGIQATQYSFNMTTYASLGTFCIFLYLYKRPRKDLPIFGIFTEATILLFSFFLAPHRLHGLIVLLPIIEFLKIEKKNFGNMFSGILRLGILLGPVLIFRIVTASNLDKYSFEMLTEVVSKNVGIFFYPISIVGSTIFPDRIVELFIEVGVPLQGDLASYASRLAIPILAIYSYLTFTVLKNNLNSKVDSTKMIIIYIIISILLLISLNQDDVPNLKTPVTTAEALIGSFTIILMSSFFMNNYKKFTKLAQVGIFGIVATLTLNIIPWLARYTATFPSDHRYLVMPSAAFIASISCMLAIFAKQKRYFATTFAIGIFAFTNIYSLQTYFDYLLKNGRASTEVDKYFNQIKSDLPSEISEGMLVFLFTSETEPMTLYHAITFGFSNHLVLIDPKFSNHESTKVLAVDNKESLLAIYKDQNSSEFSRYGMPNSKIDVENVYSYELKDKNLINKTDSTRLELNQISRKL